MEQQRPTPGLLSPRSISPSCPGVIGLEQALICLGLQQSDLVQIEAFCEFSECECYQFVESKYYGNSNCTRVTAMMANTFVDEIASLAPTSFCHITKEIQKTEHIYMLCNGTRCRVTQRTHPPESLCGNQSSINITWKSSLDKYKYKYKYKYKRQDICSAMRQDAESLNARPPKWQPDFKHRISYLPHLLKLF